MAIWTRHGFTLGADLDALTADLAHEALAQQRQNGVRAVTAAAGIYLSTKDQGPG